MAKKRKVFFDLRYPCPIDRPIFLDELGAQIQIAGTILTGNSIALGVLLPGMASPSLQAIIQPSVEQWISILQATDDPVVFETDESGATKATHRKAQRFVGASLQWQIYRRDAYACQYCGVQGGERGAILTVDHFIPVEMGGTDESCNLITACRRCNREKGSRPPDDWCKQMGVSYQALQAYLDSQTV